MFGMMRKKPDLAEEIDRTPDVVEETLSGEDMDDIISALIALKNGRFGVSLDGQGKLGEALREVGESLKDRALGALIATVTYSMNASQSMASVSQVTGSTRDTDNKVQVMASATEQLRTSIEQISETSSNAANASEQALNTVHRGVERLSMTANRMDNLGNSINAIETCTETLIAASDQIAGILETIDAIANQTNLLALNATIEAARAGEHGKGFAVVAAEVKALAGQTATATEDVRARISQLECEIASLSEATKDSINAANAGKAEMSEAQVEMETIGSQVDDVSGKMAEISNMLMEQSTAIAEISEGVTQVADLSKKNREYAENTIEAVRQSETTIEQRFGELEKQDIPDAVLYRAKSDHFLWKKRLAEMLVGLNSLNPDELADHQSCRLGKWYESITDAWFLNDPDFIALIEPHKLVHDCGIESAKHYSAGRLNDAWDAFRMMDDASIEVIALLDAIIANRKAKA
jgi:methyl-accepting chemotaxis protein